MAYIPDIIGYKPFYIQTSVDDVAIDTTQWGLVAKSNPFPILPTPKAPYKNEWKDATTAAVEKTIAGAKANYPALAELIAKVE